MLDEIEEKGVVSLERVSPSIQSELNREKDDVWGRKILCEPLKCGDTLRLPVEEAGHEVTQDATALSLD